MALASLTIARKRGKVRFSLPDSGGGTGMAMTPAYKQPQKAAITSNPWGYKSNALSPLA